VTPYSDPEQRKRYKRAARLKQKLKDDGKRVDSVRSRDLMRFVEKPRSISGGLVRSSGTAERRVPSVPAQVPAQSGTVPVQVPAIVAEVPVKQKQLTNDQAIATMPSAIRKSSASVPSAKYVDPELRRLQKELIQLRESLRPWKIGSAPWLSIQRQLVDKGSEIRTLIQRSKPRRGIVG